MKFELVVEINWSFFSTQWSINTPGLFPVDINLLNGCCLLLVVWTLEVSRNMQELAANWADIDNTGSRQVQNRPISHRPSQLPSIKGKRWLCWLTWVRYVFILKMHHVMAVIVMVTHIRGANWDRCIWNDIGLQRQSVWKPVLAVSGVCSYVMIESSPTVHQFPEFTDQVRRGPRGNLDLLQIMFNIMNHIATTVEHTKCRRIIVMKMCIPMVL